MQNIVISVSLFIIFLLIISLSNSQRNKKKRIIRAIPLEPITFYDNEVNDVLTLFPGCSYPCSGTLDSKYVVVLGTVHESKLFKYVTEE